MYQEDNQNSFNELNLDSKFSSSSVEDRHSCHVSMFLFFQREANKRL